MNCDIHNVVSVTSTVEKREPHDGLRDAYFVHKLVVETLDHTGSLRQESLTLYSNNNDEGQVTLFPPEAE